MRPVCLKELKKGDSFTLFPVDAPHENIVYVRDEYNRCTRKYICFRFSDVNSIREFKGRQIVYIDFQF